MILHYLEDGRFNGFYQPGSNDLKFPNVEITEELWHHLIDFGNFKLNIEKLNKNSTDNLILGIEDFETYFTKIEAQEEKGNHPLISMINQLEQENADLLLDSALKDSKIEQLENDLSDLMLEVASIGGN
ncbi:hypothetical protein UMC2_38211 [[Clostridium] sordellii]|uniref:hypothetical protein n=1 Tax=Paraclostridium sordellii TaxID=1505 RepID=UPI00054303DE|nr:hypothetical protein [Paeniclostridium sordellii]CEK35503.1 hypothetical protein UMC2_38211 [[Clostridium] sordellii] [Paeniclostridium sordellii]